MKYKLWVTFPGDFTFDEAKEILGEQVAKHLYEQVEKSPNYKFMTQVLPGRITNVDLANKVVTVATETI